MSSQSHEPDFKSIWQNQETEKAIMSIEDVRLNARRFQNRKTLDRIARAAFVILAAVACGIFLANARFTSMRFVAGLAMGMLLASTVWKLYRAYGRSRGKEPPVQSGSRAAMISCLEFYRSELERQQEFARLPVWHLGTLLLIVGWMTRDALMRSSSDPFRAVLPYVLFAAAGMIVLMAVRKFQARRVQDEIDALDLFESRNYSGGSHDTVDEPRP